MDSVQNVVEVSTDISKVVISPLFHPLGKGLVPFFILNVQYHFLVHVEELPWIWDCWSPLIVEGILSQNKPWVFQE